MIITAFTTKTVVKYGASLMVPAALSLGHVMEKYHRWPEAGDVPFMIGHMVTGFLLMHATAPKDTPAVQAAKKAELN